MIHCINWSYELNIKLERYLHSLFHICRNLFKENWADWNSSSEPKTKNGR